MNLDRVSSGRDVPNEVNVIIEIPANSDPVKYELDKETGAMFVDRFMTTAMRYPCNYGYVPHTLSSDGDPVDVLVITPVPLISGSVIRCRPVALLEMTDESGDDAKVLAVPVPKLCRSYGRIQDVGDVDLMLLDQIAHFLSTTRTWTRASGYGSRAGAVWTTPSARSWPASRCTRRPRSPRPSSPVTTSAARHTESVMITVTGH